MYGGPAQSLYEAAFAIGAGIDSGSDAGDTINIRARARVRGTTRRARVRDFGTHTCLQHAAVLSCYVKSGPRLGLGGRRG